MRESTRARWSLSQRRQRRTDRTAAGGPAEERNGMTTTEEPARQRTGSPGAIEANGINVIDESERKGKPSGLFWPWCASNISVLAVSYGAFVLGLRDRAVAGDRRLGGRRGRCRSSSSAWSRSPASAGSAPTLVLSRAPFGRWGNTLPGLVSYVLLVGWETVLVALSTLATATVFERLGWSHGNGTKIVAFVRGRAGDRARRDHGLRPDHAPAEVPHHRADHRHRRLRRPHLGPHPPRHRCAPSRTAAPAP